MIPHCRPVFRGREREYVEECFRTGWVATGLFVERFEEAVAKQTQSRYIVTVSSGTVALTLAIRAAYVAQTSIVSVPALTFVATANAIRAAGLAPVYRDADPVTWTARACDVPVYLYGTTPVAIGRVEDAAAALGGYTLRGMIGVLSFNGNKIVTAGGGGAVCTDNQKIAERIRAWSSHRSDVEGFMFGEGNARLSNLQAAVGLGQIEQLDDFLAAKRRIATRYTAELAGADWHPQGGPSNHWQYGGLCRDASGLVAHLRAHGIEARRLWRPLADLPVANDLYRRGVLLPCSVDLSDEDQTTVIREVKRWIASA